MRLRSDSDIFGQMFKIEDLQGIQGSFVGQVRPHPSPELGMRALAFGEMKYVKVTEGEEKVVTVPVKGVIVRRLNRPDSVDFRRFVRLHIGPKGNRDKIIGLID